MPSVTLGTIRRSALAGAAACVACFALSASPALAGDDGEAPIWESVGSIFAPVISLGGGAQSKEQIDYRDRGKLVLPPKMELNTPGAAAAAGPSDPDWPRDPDVERAKKEKAEKDGRPPILHRSSLHGSESYFGAVTPTTKVTTNATAGMGPGHAPCDPSPGHTCQTETHPSIDWNPLTWVGVQKKQATVLGPEPDRDWLTDPPQGYREPAEGVGVHVDN
jgi:hypothetical protein